MTNAIVDSVGMFGLAAGLPEQVHEAAERASQLSFAVDPATIENVVVIGMGGSGMAGEVVRAVVASPILPVPVIISKSYECPGFVGPDSLVFAISASGDTEETVQAASDAHAAGAQMIVVAGGGQLAELATSWEAPVAWVPDIPQPRAALGAMAIPPLVVLDKLGLYRGGRSWIDLAVDQLNRRRDELEEGGDSSAAASLARRIGRTMALVHGGGSVGSAAAQRWKTQINENAKAPAWWSAQPELCHNEVCGWGQNGDVTRQVITAVALRHDGEHPQVGRRFELVGDLMREVVADVVEVRAAGDGDLAQLLDLILFGDYVSLWMAAEAGIDPGPVPVLGELKAALSGP